MADDAEGHRGSEELHLLSMIPGPVALSMTKADWDEHYEFVVRKAIALGLEPPWAWREMHPDWRELVARIHAETKEG